ncbi:MAG: AAA family ATPase, partial [Pirellulaceae bacterium]
MRINVPIYITQRKGDGGSSVVAKPLFFARPERTGRELGRVIATLSDDLRVLLTEKGRSDSHAELMRWHHAESIWHQVTKLSLDLRDSTARLKLLLIVMERFNRKLVFSPSLPDLWFDVMPGEDVEQRAIEVYQSHFRQLVKELPSYPVAGHGIDGKAWIDELMIDVTPRSAPKESSDPLRAFLGGQDVSDGAAELQATGRCLSRIDIDQLALPIGVDSDIRRLMRLLDGGDRRNVVLVGPSGSGKTARIEGVARQRRGQKRSAIEGLMWQLSPARLISGMSYLGQWQERVLAIIGHAHQQDHILYFEDFLGLYEAGKTRDSVMCVADTLRAQLQVQPVRLLTEMTAEAWAILRERDRTLADQFVVMPTAAMDPQQSMRVMTGVRQRLEAAGKCRFDWDVLPEVISMYDRFDRSSVLPGKAVAALHRLASRAAVTTINRNAAVAEFKSRSGLHGSMIDRNREIDRGMITALIGTEVIGQVEPVDQLVDRIMVAAARLNDTSRPIGTYLLVGPTGVGKTQLAKAVASRLFDEGGLIRLDMNELSSPASAARLVGTFDAPDGLLTSAVRRRPNAVLLLDEIEKAHPAVLDVLLQALGEARMSDARGRTVDFSGLLILMTSNLGARTSGKSSGFTSADDPAAIQANHQKAIREFFRPEFFNRIDGVLSFQRLSPEVMESIAKMQFREIIKRDGLQRRNVLFDVDPDVIRHTANRGYDPAMGARALKRQIEQDLIRPAARVLAETDTEQPMLLQMYHDGQSIRHQWQAIEMMDLDETPVQLSNDELCDRAERWLDSVVDGIDGGPLSFEVGVGGVDPKALETMTLRDSLLECQQSLRELRESSTRESRARGLQRPVSTPLESANTPPSYRFEPPTRSQMRDWQAVDDIRDFVNDALVQTRPSDLDPLRERFINQLGRFRDQLAARGSPQRVLIWTRWFGQSLAEQEFGYPHDASIYPIDMLVLSDAIQQWATQQENLAVGKFVTSDPKLSEHVVEYSGALVTASVLPFCGSWLWVSESGEMQLADVRMMEIRDGE